MGHKEIKTLKLLLLFLLLLLFSCESESKEDTNESDFPKRDLSVSNGEIWFRQYCSSCHSINLRTPQTASPLGRISDFRDSSYLVSAVKNFSREVQNGTPIAVCQYERYTKVVMLPFDRLTNSEVFAILNFIKSESIRLNISIAEMEIHHNCTENNKRLNLDSLARIQPQPNHVFDKEEMIKNFYNYFFDDFTFNPYSKYDDTEYKINNFSLSLSPYESKVFKVYMVNYKKNEIKPLYYFRDKFYFHTQNFSHSVSTERLPDLEKLLFIAIEESSNDTLSFGSKFISFEALNKENIITTSPKSKFEIKKYLKEIRQ